MSVPAVAKLAPLLPYLQQSPELPALARRYRDNSPFPHIHLTDFLDPEIAGAMAEEFPPPNTEAWPQYNHNNKKKRGLSKRTLSPRHIGEVTDELNSPEFVSWLSQLTGIPGLVADSSLEGGGLL